MGWSKKYKKSINCNQPKGFSQKAHCAGKKKRKNEDMVFEEITEDILNEKLITYGNRKPYGQVVFIAGGAGCFSADTQVKTQDGYKHISEIKAGDKVYSYNSDTGNCELDSVLETYSYKVNDLPGTQDILELEFDNGTVIRCTENHEFYIDNEWIMAKDIQINTDM